MVLLNCSKPTKLPLRDYHTLRCSFPGDFKFPSYGKEQPHHISIVFPQQIQFALCRVQSILITASRLISFPIGTKMFQFPMLFILTDLKRKSYSEISGSKLTCSSPKHNVASHILHQQIEPSHPPNSMLGFLSVHGFILNVNLTIQYHPILNRYEMINMIFYEYKMDL